MKTLSFFGAMFLGAASWLTAATNDLSTTLQKGLFEEEANHDLPAAIQAYQSVATQFDRDRKLAATAIFRLGECYRKQGNTNEAILQYQRVLTDFADQAPLVTLSRENLAGMGAAGVPVAASVQSSGARLEQKRLLEEEIKLVEQKLAAEQKQIEAGTASKEIVWASQRDLLELKRQIAALDAGELLSIASADGSGPTTATEAEEIKRIQALIKDSPDLINALIPGNTQRPLQQAAAKGQLRVAEFLLNSGADAVAIGRDGYAALHSAANAGHRTMVELLLNHGVPVDLKDKKGETALHLAAGQGFKGVAEMLIEHKANLNDQDDRGWTPLHKAASAGHLSIVELLLAHNADVNLHGSKPPIKVDPIDWRTSETTPLVEAILAKRLDVVKLLLANHADVNFWCDAWLDQNNLSAGPSRPYRGLPLHFAINVGSPETVEQLLKAGADPNFPNPGSPQGETPLIFALNMQANAQAQDIASRLLSSKADPDAPNPNGEAPLHLAVRDRSTNLVSLLLENHAKVDPRNRDGLTPLHLAVLNREPAVAAVLLDHNADPNAKANDGETPLHSAVRYGFKELVELLISKGADVNLPNNSGYTPLALTQPMPARRPTMGGPGVLPPLPGVPVSGSEQRNTPDELVRILRQHGAVTELPDFSSIRVTRQGYTPEVIFRKGTNSVNVFTLLEVIRNLYPSGNLNAIGGIQTTFPDFSKVRILRSAPTFRTGSVAGLIDLLTPPEKLDCAKDGPLEFGDIVEIPERVHGLAETPFGLTAEQNSQLNECLKRTVTFVVNGSPTEVKFYGNHSNTYLANALRLGNVQAKLRSSSDFSKVHVKRTDPSTGQVRDFVEDVQPFWSGSTPIEDDLWLRDGDVVEIPDKP